MKNYTIAEQFAVIALNAQDSLHESCLLYTSIPAQYCAQIDDESGFQKHTDRAFDMAGMQ